MIVSPIVSVAAAYFGISLGVEAAKGNENKKTTARKRGGSRSGNETLELEEKEEAEGQGAPTDQTEKL